MTDTPTEIKSSNAGPPESDPATAAILDAAARLLAERGVSGFTTDALAKAASVSKSSIYSRWRSKDEIFVSLTGHVAGAATVADVGDLAAELRAWFADRQKVYNQPGFRQVITSLIEIASHDPVVDSEMAVYLHNQHTTFKQIVRRAQERGEVDSGWDPALLEDYVIGPVMYRVLLDDEPLDDETLDAFRRLAMTALLGTPPPA